MNNVSADRYVPPHRRHLLANSSTLPKEQSPRNSTVTLSEEQLEFYRRIGGIIKTAISVDPEHLLKKAINPYWEDATEEGKSQLVPWAPGNWALWIRLFVQLDQNQALADPRNTKYRVEAIIKRYLIKQIPTCPAGQCAQISQAAAQLNLNRSQEFSDWLLKNGKENINDFSAQEIYMLIDGARKFLNSKNLHSLLQAYSSCLTQDEEKVEILKRDLKPQGIACLLKVCAQLKMQGALSDLLLEMALKDFCLFSIQEKIDLIAGLALYSNNQDVQKLLKKIEDNLAKECLSHGSLIITCHHFKDCGFFPLKLLPEANSRLTNPKTPLWDKINLLHALVTSNPHEDVKKHFYSLLKNLSQPQENGSLLFETIYPQELTRVLEMASKALTKGNPYPHPINEIVQHLVINRLSTTSQSNLSFLRPILSDLDYQAEAQQVQKKLNEMRKQPH